MDCEVESWRKENERQRTANDEAANRAEQEVQRKKRERKLLNSQVIIVRMFVGTLLGSDLTDSTE